MKNEFDMVTGIFGVVQDATLTKSITVMDNDLDIKTQRLAYMPKCRMAEHQVVLKYIMIYTMQLCKHSEKTKRSTMWKRMWVA